MENQEQQLKETKAAPSHKNYSNRKRNAMLKLHAQPLYPRLAIVLLVCLLVLTCVLTVAEIFRSRTLWESGILLRNVVTAGLGIFGVYMPFLSFWYASSECAGIHSETDAERQRDRRAIRRLNRTYVGYITLSLAGILLWGILFLIAR